MLIKRMMEFILKSLLFLIMASYQNNRLMMMLNVISRSGNLKR